MGEKKKYDAFIIILAQPGWGKNQTKKIAIYVAILLFIYTGVTRPFRSSTRLFFAGLFFLPSDSPGRIRASRKTRSHNRYYKIIILKINNSLWVPANGHNSRRTITLTQTFTVRFSVCVYVCLYTVLTTYTQLNYSSSPHHRALCC